MQNNTITDSRGLSEAEVLLRRQRGQGNNVRLETSRTYAQIVRSNVFTFINAVLFGIGIVLVLLGLYTDALLSVGIALMNVVIGLAQEVRAKRALDKIALLTRPKATVIRDGVEKVIDPTEIVLGDLLVARAGDQIVVDGRVTSSHRVDVDESLLTGESDLIAKRQGDPVYSGSYCVSGSATYVAEKVGVQSLANQITAGARAFRQVKTPLQHDIDFIIRVLLALCTAMAVLFGIAAFVANLPLTETARIAAVVAGLIPNGLFFMISISYAMGAVRMAGRGALIQQSNAVESMSNVNVLCLDKTGTLTANRIELRDTFAEAISDAELRRTLGLYAASATDGNRTSEALGRALPGDRLSPVEEVPFSSDRKWSALAFDQPELSGVYVLGAPEVLHTELSDEARRVADKWREQGLRVLLFAVRSDVSSLFDEAGQPHVPEALRPLGLLAFADELRAEAQATLEGFAQAGIRVKIISGDNPQTVAALARQAGLDSARLLSGADLDALNDEQFASAAEHTTIFGRITPQQKERLVDALKANGHYVAMIGDGVNDVLSLKKAHIGVAMQSGSQATRGVADIILLNDSFAALPSAFSEGQRIVNGMLDIMRLFLTRVLSQTLIILGVAVIGLGFPITPIHQSLLSLFTVGIPVLVLAAWARPGKPGGRLILSVIQFMLPAGTTLGVVGVLVYVLYYVGLLRGAGIQDVLGTIDPLVYAPILEMARTMLTTVTTIGGLIAILLVEPPTRFWASGEAPSGDLRPTWLALGLLALYLLIMFIPDWRAFFELSALEGRDWLLVAGALALWTLAMRFLLRKRIVARFMRFDG